MSGDSLFPLRARNDRVTGVLLTKQSGRQRCQHFAFLPSSDSVNSLKIKATVDHSLSWSDPESYTRIDRLIRKYKQRVREVHDHLSQSIATRTSSRSKILGHHASIITRVIDSKIKIINIQRPLKPSKKPSLHGDKKQS